MQLRQCNFPHAPKNSQIDVVTDGVVLVYVAACVPCKIIGSILCQFCQRPALGQLAWNQFTQMAGLKQPIQPIKNHTRAIIYSGPKGAQYTAKFGILYS